MVETKNVTVQVLGTAFDVDLTDGITQVALAHGSVEASFRNAAPTRLIPGEMLIVDASGAIRKESVSVEDIGGWRNGELYVVDATIGSVVEQIQRYHPAWLTMADKRLAEQRVTGFTIFATPTARWKHWWNLTGARCMRLAAAPASSPASETVENKNHIYFQ